MNIMQNNPAPPTNFYHSHIASVKKRRALNSTLSKRSWKTRPSSLCTEAHSPPPFMDSDHPSIFPMSPTKHHHGRTHDFEATTDDSTGSEVSQPPRSMRGLPPYMASIRMKQPRQARDQTLCSDFQPFTRQSAPLTAQAQEPKQCTVHSPVTNKKTIELPT